MLILKPISYETIWGSNRLYDYCGDINMPKIGQLYTVAAQDYLSNEILNGEYKGQSLYNMYNNERSLFEYDKYEVFPLLIGFVDASDNLSIQIHPTDEYAIAKEYKPFGKSESWVFLEVPKRGVIYNGVNCNSVEEVKENIENNSVMSILGNLEINKSDYVYVEAGTIHALTAGSLVYEIQQSTDITYRFYDFDRVDKKGNKRGLHQEKALAVIDPAKKSSSAPYLANKYYEEEYYTTRLSNVNGIYHNEQAVFVCVTVIEGELEYDNVSIKKGMSFIAFPGEKIKLVGSAKCITAIPR